MVAFVKQTFFTAGGRELDLTPTEYRLLEVFMRNSETVMKRDAITLQVWGYDSGDSNYLDVHIGHLREKLESGGQSRLVSSRGSRPPRSLPAGSPAPRAVPSAWGRTRAGARR